MATASMQKDFFVTDKQASERYRKALKNAGCSIKRTAKPAPSLELGKEKLKHFSFNMEYIYTSDNSVGNSYKRYAV